MKASKNKFIRLPGIGFRWIIPMLFILLLNSEIAFSQFDGKIESFEFIYRQDFSGEPDDWNLEPDTGKWGSVDYSFTDETYRWEMNLKKDVLNYQTPDPIIYLPEDGYRIGVETYFEDTCDDCASGLLYNLQDESNFYYVRLYGDGYIQVYAKEDNEWEALSEAVQSEYFIPSESNRITVISDGDNFEIQLNDYPIFNFTDSRFHGGTFGLAAEAPKGTQLAVRFDNIDVMKKGSTQVVDLEEETVTETEEPALEEETVAETEEPDWENESPYRINKVTAPMNDFYPPDEESVLTDYTLDISIPITFWKEERGNLFCPKESNENACVFIIQHFDRWGSPSEAADDILGKYAEQVEDFEIFDEEETFTKDGFYAYRVGTYFTIDGKNYEGSHLFVQVQNVVFQIMSYGTRGTIDKYREDLKQITDSFSFEYF